MGSVVEFIRAEEKEVAGGRRRESWEGKSVEETTRDVERHQEVVDCR